MVLTFETGSHLLALLLADPKQAPHVQKRVGRGCGLPLCSSLRNVLLCAVVDVALQTLLNTDVSNLHNIHLVAAMLQKHHHNNSYLLQNNISKQALVKNIRV